MVRTSMGEGDVLFLTSMGRHHLGLLIDVGLQSAEEVRIEAHIKEGHLQSKARSDTKDETVGLVDTVPKIGDGVWRILEAHLTANVPLWMISEIEVQNSDEDRQWRKGDEVRFPAVVEEVQSRHGKGLSKRPWAD